MEDPEVPLSGGNATTGGVVRIGDTVRKPWGPTSPRVAEYMLALRECGIDLPAPLGRDDRGRLVLELVPGEPAMDRLPLDVVTTRRVGALVRQIHDASEGLAVPEEWPVLLPTASPDLLCHNDLAAWNLLIDGERLVFFDWDGAGPSTRVWDLAYSAISFGSLFPKTPVADSCALLSAFLTGYGADAALRAELLPALAARSAAMHEHLRRSHEAGVAPWASMYESFHGEHWRSTTEHIGAHESDWERALGLAKQER